MLYALGIGRDVDAASTPMTSIEFVNHQGKRLGRNPDELLPIKRGALNRVLRENAIVHGVGVEFAKRLVRVSDDGGRVTARFADGSEATGDVLVGCDGVHSVTRQAILPDGPRWPTPVWSARAASSGCPMDPSTAPDMEMTFGLRAFFGYQATPGEIFWFQNTPQPTEPQPAESNDDDQHWKARLVEQLRGPRPHCGPGLHVEAPQLRALPTEQFDTGLWLSRGSIGSGAGDRQVVAQLTPSDELKPDSAMTRPTHRTTTALRRRYDKRAMWCNVRVPCHLTRRRADV